MGRREHGLPHGGDAGQRAGPGVLGKVSAAAASDSRICRRVLHPQGFRLRSARLRRR